MDIKKILLISLIAIAILASVSAVSAGWFGLFGDDNAGDNTDVVEDITLIKESTKGDHYIYDDGEEYTYYDLKGVIKGLPKDGEGYSFKTAIYDKSGKLIKEGDQYSSMGYLSSYFKKSEPDTLSQIKIDGFKNVSFYELKVYDPNGATVLEKNITFKMENMNTFHRTKSS